MSRPPTGSYVPCPDCEARATAIVPANAEIVADEAVADGKVWVDCLECGGRFLVHFRSDGE